MRPIYETACFWPKGGTVIIHPALTAADAATPTRWLKGLDLCRLEHRSLGHEAGCEIAPERHDQLARQGHDGDALDALAGIECASPILLGEFAVRLMPQPQPGQFDRGTAGARIARLADPLVAVDPAALPRTGCQPEIAPDFTPIAEVLVERLVGQRRRERRTEAFKPEQQLATLGYLSRRRGQIRRSLHQRIKLLTHQHQPRMFALDLGHDLRRHLLALPGPLLHQPGQPIAPARV